MDGNFCHLLLHGDLDSARARLSESRSRESEFEPECQWTLTSNLLLSSTYSGWFLIRCSIAAASVVVTKFALILVCRYISPLIVDVCSASDRHACMCFVLNYRYQVRAHRPFKLLLTTISPTGKKDTLDAIVAVANHTNIHRFICHSLAVG